MTKIVILIGFFLLSNNLIAFSDIELGLLKKNNGVILYLLNTSLADVYVNKRFAIGPADGLNEVELVFTNADGQKFLFMSKVRTSPASEKDYNLLGADMFVGRYFSLDQLSRYYALVQGEYKVKAIYKDRHLVDKTAFSEKLESKPISITIE
ncbi:hypothetical protein [Spartinivicinus poritis]|uniref:Gingipain propeptide domain-containing protein n=1 Tax=Spartinivicinus poritis TaxID=2994640 RepID=A0ABT5UH67_9GAMM|nr:hypothetical protein [Spartinivicinus sp. A2-2]MDE1465711.1 hypothetical protein [Spartinivicinus sp. A2-2]